jgi:hypothetical protein
MKDVSAQLVNVSRPSAFEGARAHLWANKKEVDVTVNVAILPSCRSEEDACCGFGRPLSEVLPQFSNQGIMRIEGGTDCPIENMVVVQRI